MNAKRTKTPTTQTVPIEISRYYRQRLPSGKPGQLTWSEGPARKDQPGMERRHFTVKRVRVGTTLPELFAAIAKELRAPVEDLTFNIWAQPERISITARPPGWRHVAGRVASVAVRGLVSPCPWRTVDQPSPWDRSNLPEGLDTLRTYPASVILSRFTPAQIAGPWRWKRIVQTEAQKRNVKLLKLTTKLLRLRNPSDRDLTAIDAVIKKVRTRRAA